MPLPLGRRGLVSAAAIAAGVVYWRVRGSRQSKQWERSIDDAVAQGAAAGRKAADADARHDG